MKLEEFIRCGGLLDMQIRMESLVIDWAKGEPKMGQIIRYIYVHCRQFNFQVDYAIFLARSIALKKCYLMMNFEKKIILMFFKISVKMQI